MKITNIKEGKVYLFKNIDSLNDFCNGERILVKKVVDEELIYVDFLDYKRPILNMSVSADEIKRLKS